MWWRSLLDDRSVGPLKVIEEVQQHFVHEDDTGAGTYAHSYDLHPLIILWICAVEKVRYIKKEGTRHDIRIDTPVRVSFDWAATERGPQFRGTHIEEAEKDTITIHRYTPGTRGGTSLSTSTTRNICQSRHKKK